MFGSTVVLGILGHAWLSSKITVGSVNFPFSSLYNSLNQTASCAAADKATYSASAVDRETHSCFLLFQLIAVPPISKQ